MRWRVKAKRPDLYLLTTHYTPFFFLLARVCYYYRFKDFLMNLSGSYVYSFLAVFPPEVLLSASVVVARGFPPSIFIFFSQ